MRQLTICITLLFSIYGATAQRYDVDIDFDCFLATIKMPDHIIEASVWDDDEKRLKVNDQKWYSWFRSNMIVTTQAGYDGKLLHGKYQEFYLTKQIKKQGNYHFGLKDGTWKEWYADGQLKSIYHWNKGFLHGEFTEYTQKGLIVVSGSYKNNLLHGKYQQYYNGQLVSEVKMKNGTEVKPRSAENEKRNNNKGQLDNEKGQKKKKNTEKKVKPEKADKKKKEENSKKRRRNRDEKD